MSGLKQVMKVLKGVDDVAICQFSHKDVVRHQLVQRIIAAYDKFERSRASAEQRRSDRKDERTGKYHG